MGANTTMLGQVGKDSEGEAYIAFFKKSGVKTDHILKSETQRTG